MPESHIITAFGLIGLAAIVLLVVGVFLSTSVEPGPRRTKSILSRPWVARGAALVAIAATVGALRSRLAARSTDVLTDWHPALIALDAALWFLEAAALLLASVCLLRYLMTLADRLPDRKLARRTWQAEILLCGVTILLVAQPLVNTPALRVATDWILLTLVLLVLGTALFIWSLMGAYRRAIKQTISAAVPQSELFGASGPPRSVAGSPSSPGGAESHSI